MTTDFALIRIIREKEQTYLVPILENQVFQNQIESPRKKSEPVKCSFRINPSHIIHWGVIQRLRLWLLGASNLEGMEQE